MSKGSSDRFVIVLIVGNGKYFIVIVKDFWSCKYVLFDFCVI